MNSFTVRTYFCQIIMQGTKIITEFHGISSSMWFFQWTSHCTILRNVYAIFLGVTLKGENSSITWNPQEKEDEEFPDRANKLIVKQILLGVEAGEEYNVIEVS